jgi:hypothetical protein
MRNKLVAALVLGVVFTLGAGAGRSSANWDFVNSAAAGAPLFLSTSTPAGTRADDKPSPQPTASRYAQPTPKMFSLTVMTLTSQCFRKAGCNVTYRVALTYKGTLPLDPAKTYVVTYKVSGLEDPAANKLTVTGNTYKFAKDEFGQTTTSRFTLAAAATAVFEQ